jgi:prepilin-type N-terminal cleavage/methylation domain-containing protein
MNSARTYDTRSAELGFRVIRRGMTLLELTVVILVLLSLISILFVGAQAWKRGSDRTLCIMNIQSVQKGVRSFANLYGYSPGQSVTGLQIRVVGLGKFVESTPACPSSGSYSYGAIFGADTIPPVGELYMSCSLSTMDGHMPVNYADW